MFFHTVVDLREKLVYVNGFCFYNSHQALQHIHNMADMKQKSLYRGSNNSSEIMSPAVCHHTNGLPLVVLS